MLIKAYESEIQDLQTKLNKLINQANYLDRLSESNPSWIQVFRSDLDSDMPFSYKCLNVEVPNIRIAIINHIRDYVNELTTKESELKNELSILTYSKKPE